MAGLLVRQGAVTRTIAWPAAWRIPCAGECIVIDERDFEVTYVAWDAQSAQVIVGVQVP